MSVRAYLAYLEGELESKRADLHARLDTGSDDFIDLVDSYNDTKAQISDVFFRAKNVARRRILRR
jgi:hypothetical protein